MGCVQCSGNLLDCLLYFHVFVVTIALTRQGGKEFRALWDSLIGINPPQKQSRMAELLIQAEKNLECMVEEEIDDYNTMVSTVCFSSYDIQFFVLHIKNGQPLI